ncbi:hypothetical protein [Anabaena sp. CCY 9402-a]
MAWLHGNSAVHHLSENAVLSTLKVIRRAIADFQDANSEQLTFFSPN